MCTFPKTEIGLSAVRNVSPFNLVLASDHASWNFDGAVVRRAHAARIVPKTSQDGHERISLVTRTPVEIKMGLVCMKMH